MNNEHCCGIFFSSTSLRPFFRSFVRLFVLIWLLYAWLWHVPTGKTSTYTTCQPHPHQLFKLMSCSSFPILFATPWYIEFKRLKFSFDFLVVFYTISTTRMYLLSVFFLSMKRAQAHVLDSESIILFSLFLFYSIISFYLFRFLIALTCVCWWMGIRQQDLQKGYWNLKVNILTVSCTFIKLKGILIWPANGLWCITISQMSIALHTNPIKNSFVGFWVHFCK